MTGMNMKAKSDSTSRFISRILRHKPEVIGIQKKRVVFRDVENKRGKPFSDYRDEFEYLTDDYDSLSAVPIEVKSGKDYSVHSTWNTFVKNDDYNAKKAFVLSNGREITTNGRITVLPIYEVMFFGTM